MKIMCLLTISLFVVSLNISAAFVNNPETTKSFSVSNLQWTTYEEDWICLHESWYVHFVRNHNATNAPSQNCLSLGGQKFYVYSLLHHNVHYSGQELDVEFFDVDGDGWQDLIISGIVNYTGTVDFEIYEQESVLFIYLCDPVEQRFALKYKKASFDVEVEDDAYVQWKKRYNSVFGADYRELDARKISEGEVVRTQHPWHYVNSARCTKDEIREILNPRANQ